MAMPEMEEMEIEDGQRREDENGGARGWQGRVIENEASASIFGKIKKGLEALKANLKGKLLLGNVDGGVRIATDSRVQE